jgi:nitroimidazol reductase NimA-like FMN-containing flavoprotein (pyridoxamine 5'-phosphate oxidase superfamily)
VPSEPAEPDTLGAVHAVLDEAPICHVAFVEDGRPMVLPALHGRVGAVLYLHGSLRGALLRAAASGASLSINAVVLDGVAVARTACHSALNYRSALLTGVGRPVEDLAEKESALRAITERITPGGWERGRPPSAEEIRGTTVVAVTIAQATLRERSGPPKDDEADLTLPCWAGVVPLRLVADSAVTDPRLPAGLPVPPVLAARQPEAP